MRSVYMFSVSIYALFTLLEPIPVYLLAGKEHKMNKARGTWKLLEKMARISPRGGRVQSTQNEFFNVMATDEVH